MALISAALRAMSTSSGIISKLALFIKISKYCFSSSKLDSLLGWTNTSISEMVDVMDEISKLSILAKMDLIPGK